jgi:hypothetical protein
MSDALVELLAIVAVLAGVFSILAGLAAFLDRLQVLRGLRDAAREECARRTGARS